jgi:hypothetical protein
MFRLMLMLSQQRPRKMVIEAVPFSWPHILLHYHAACARLACISHCVASSNAGGTGVVIHCSTLVNLQLHSLSMLARTREQNTNSCGTHACWSLDTTHQTITQTSSQCSSFSGCILRILITADSSLCTCAYLLRHCPGRSTPRLTCAST